MKSKFWVICIFILIICSISIGFAASVTELSFTDINVLYRPNADMRITDVLVSNSNDFINYSIDYNSKNLFLDVEFDSDTSYAIYDIEITNFGNVAMGILKFDNLNDNLNYEFLDYDLESKICNDNSDENQPLNAIASTLNNFMPTSEYNGALVETFARNNTLKVTPSFLKDLRPSEEFDDPLEDIDDSFCILGVSKTIKLKVSPKDGNTGRYNLQLSFAFRDFVTITYYNISGFTSEKAMRGSSIEIYLPLTKPYIGAIYNESGVETNYTQEYNILYIYDISSNLFIYGSSGRE